MAAKTTREPDPPTQLRELERTLASAQSAASMPPAASTPPMARGFAVRGDERYFREAALALVDAAAQARGFEVCKHDAHDPDFDLHALLDDLSAAPMFASGRAVLVRSAGALLKKEGDGPSALTRALLSFLESKQVPGCIAIEAEALRADHALCKAIVKHGGALLACRRLYSDPPPWDPDPRKAELVQWVLARARELGLALDAKDAAYVAAATGNDLFALDTALDNLRRRGTQGVREIVAWTSAVSPFELAEQLCRGDASSALAGIESLFRLGLQTRDGAREVDLGAVLVMFQGSLRGKLRQSAAGAAVLEQGGDLAAAAASAGVDHPRARPEFEARLAARPPAHWRAMLEDFGALERRARSGAAIDANDFVALALRWRVEPARRAVAARR